MRFAMKNENIENVTFEDALKRLEEIVRLLEGGDTALDVSLDLYEEAVSLVEICNSKLDSAQQKVTMLNSNENA
jgi:exodeoxyribonuclease VII small subunit